MTGTQTRPDPALIREVLGSSLGYLYPAALRVVIKLGIPEQLASGPRTADELAEATGSSASHLRRILRFVASHGAFDEDAEGRFGLTPVSDMLRTDAVPSVRSTVLLLTDELYWRSTGELEEITRRGHTVFDEIFGAPLFDVLAGDRDRATLFNQGIAAISEIEQDAVAAAYTFAPGSRVIDVAGGPGGLLGTILRRDESLSGMLVEQASVLEAHVLDRPELAGRWETASADFFDSLPGGGDYYLLKRVLHDWNDEDSERILRTCHAAMPANAKLLVVDAVIPPGNDQHPSKLYDIAMMTIFDGRERTEPEFVRLMGATGFTIERIIPTTGTVSIVEATPGAAR